MILLHSIYNTQKQLTTKPEAEMVDMYIEMTWKILCHAIYTLEKNNQTPDLAAIRSSSVRLIRTTEFGGSSIC